MHNQTLTDAAKLLGTGRNRLTRDLKERGILDHNRLPRQRDIDAGRFAVKLKQHTKNPYMNQGNGQLYHVTLVTPKGLLWLANQLGVTVEQEDQERAA
jgi:phage antirepressor YoqD-like protein